MSYTRTQIMSAVITTLTPLKTDGTVKTVEVYSGQIADLDKRQTLPILPALLVGYSGGAIKNPARYSEERSYAFTVIVVSGNLAGEKSRNDEAAKIIDAVETKLHRQNLGLDLSGSINFDRDVLIASARNAVAYAIDITVPFRKGYLV